MRIEDLTPGLALTFLVSINGEQLTFGSKVQEVFPKKHLVLADAIFHNDKIVSFRGENTLVNLLVTFENEKPVLFQNVTITTMKKADSSYCYNISAPTEGKPFNRREHFRCFVGLPTAVHLGLNQSSYDAILRDVSASGFAITCTSDVEISPNQIVHALLDDYIDELSEQFSFHLYGLIVRSQELENGKIVYGCRLNNHVTGLEGYIMKKERIRLRNTNGGKL